MSVDGIRISHVTSKTRELSKYMGQVLDEDWKKARGIEIQSVGIASISYDEESQKLINMRNQGAMMGDPNIREGFVQSSIAKGLEAAGSNANGAMAGYMGMGMGIQGAGGFMNAASNTNMQQMQQQAQYQQMMNQQFEQLGANLLQVQIYNFGGLSSRTVSPDDMYALVDKYPQYLSGVSPYVMTGATDAHFYQEICDSCVRFAPVIYGPEQMRGMHGLNENIEYRCLPGAVRFYQNLIRAEK